MKELLEEPTSLKTRVPYILTILIIVMLVFAGFSWILHRAHAPKQPQPVARKTVPAPEVPRPYQLPNFSVAGVHAIEGIEHPLIRQLIANPSLAGYTGDENDTAAVKQWAGHEVHVRTLKAGLIGRKFGEEIRVKTADQLAFVFQKDDKGNLVIVQYTATALAAAAAAQASRTTIASPLAGGITKDGILLTTEIIYPIAPAIAQSHFVGPQDGTTVLSPPHAQHLYMYVG
jgi:hypothetical protein